MRRLLATAAVSLTAALVLSGCLKVDADLTVHEDATVSGEMTLAMSKAGIEMMQGFADSFGEGEADSDTEFDEDFFENDEVPEGATVKPYEDDKFVGQTMSFDKISIDELNDSATDDSDDSWTITRDGDTFVFEASADFTNDDAEGLNDGSEDFGMDALFAESEMRIAVTFPGEVLEANGTIGGRTVVWTPEFGEQLEMRAVAKSEGSSSNMVILVAVGVAALLLILGLVLLLVRRRPGRVED